MIRDEICTCEVAILAKEKGFPLRKVIKQDDHAFFYELPQSHPDWANCDAWYLPTQSLLQRWLRDEKKYAIAVFWDMLSKAYYYEIVKTIGVLEIQVGEKYNYSKPKGFDTYELAFEDALKYALENLV